MPTYLAKPPSPRLQFGHPLAARRVGIWPLAERGGTTLHEAAGGPSFVIYNGATPGVSGVDGPGVRFLAGPVQYGELPLLGSAALPSGSLTVHLRTRLDAWSASGGLLSWAPNALDGLPWFLIQWDAATDVRVLQGNVYRPGATVAVGETHDFTVTCDGAASAWSFYMDGRLAASWSAAFDGGTLSQAQGLFLNCGYPATSSATHSFLGVWDRCLSPSAVAALAADPHAALRPRRSLATLAAAAVPRRKYVVIRRV